MLIAFSSVGREGLESAFFTVAFAFEANPCVLLSGALVGLLASIGLCVLIYRLGYRLDFRLFFRVMGLLLLFFGAGLLGDAILNLQQLGWLPFGTQTLWDTSDILEQVPYIDTLRDLLHGIVGYTDAPTVLQIVCYASFFLITGSIFTRMTRKIPAEPSSRSISTSTSAAKS
jgi:high-affinity iron transporter